MALEERQVVEWFVQIAMALQVSRACVGERVSVCVGGKVTCGVVGRSAWREGWNRVCVCLCVCVCVHCERCEVLQTAIRAWMRLGLWFVWKNLEACCRVGVKDSWLEGRSREVGLGGGGAVAVRDANEETRLRRVPGPHQCKSAWVQRRESVKCV